MKRTVTLLLAVILLFALVSCNGIQNRTNNNKENTGVTGIQNFYSGVTDISEVRSYFKKSLGMDINDLYCFRYYEIINVIDYQEILLQFKRYDNSSYEYMIYYNGSVQGYLNDVYPGEVIPLSEKPNSQLSNKKYQVSELTFDTTPRESHIKPISIITDIEEKVIRIIESDVSVYTIEYNKDHTISAISHFINYYDLTKHLFSDDDLYDAEHCFEEDNADGYVKQIYNYNTDGSASQVDNYDHSLAVNAFDESIVNTDIKIKYEYAYDKNGYRISERIFRNNGEDNVEFERDNNGMLQRIYSLLHYSFKEDEIGIVDINYDTDGLIIPSEMEYKDK